MTWDKHQKAELSQEHISRLAKPEEIEIRGHASLDIKSKKVWSGKSNWSLVSRSSLKAWKSQL